MDSPKATYDLLWQWYFQSLRFEGFTDTNFDGRLHRGSRSLVDGPADVSDVLGVNQLLESP